MGKFFVYIYEWFDRHKSVFYVILTALILTLGFFAVQVRFNENISNFFSKDEKSSAVFENIKLLYSNLQNGTLSS